MFWIFSKKKQKEKEQVEEPIPASHLIAKLDQIIELLEQQQNQRNARNIHFDTVQIDHLENIVFHLDKIDIDELSGKLIIGNNISTTNDLAEALNQQINPKGSKSEEMSDKTSSNQETLIKTSKGFRFHYDS
ncbi:hypothetical protein [Neobacillus vireti]|uniref:hypothetical protein n=1 Tax=Neobacillus vireti TaxID=220686 RepID=UPI002FFF27B7